MISAVLYRKRTVLQTICLSIVPVRDMDELHQEQRDIFRHRRKTSIASNHFPSIAFQPSTTSHKNFSFVAFILSAFFPALTFQHNKILNNIHHA